MFFTKVGAGPRALQLNWHLPMHEVLGGLEKKKKRWGLANCFLILPWKSRLYSVTIGGK